MTTNTKRKETQKLKWKTQWAREKMFCILVICWLELFYFSLLFGSWRWSKREQANLSVPVCVYFTYVDEGKTQLSINFEDCFNVLVALLSSFARSMPFSSSLSFSSLRSCSRFLFYFTRISITFIPHNHIATGIVVHSICCQSQYTHTRTHNTQWINN